MQAVDILLANEAIKQLFHRRLRYMDTRQWSLYADLHTDDVMVEHGGDGTQINGKQAVADAVQQFMTQPVPITSVHHGFNPDIEITSESTAKAIWPMEDRLWWQRGDVEEWWHGFGHYHEHYQKVDGQWLISYRKLTRLHVEMSAGFISRE